MATSTTELPLAGALAVLFAVGCGAAVVEDVSEPQSQPQSHASTFGQATSIAFEIRGEASTYAGQSRDDLVTLLDASPLLCRAELDSTERYGGSRVSPGPCSSVGRSARQGYYLEVPFEAPTAMTFDVRLGADYGRGGALFLDGNLLRDSREDLWWEGDWQYGTASGQVLSANAVPLGQGTHVLEAIGFERCCGGPQSLEIRTAASNWQPFVVDAASH